ncbi:acyltransferase [Neomicrococcus lactis]
MLAVLVIFGHAFPLGGFQSFQFGPFIHSGLHGAAVDGFFVISGYLIFASALRTRTLAYFWRRFLRIYPGYLVAILVTAFLFAPLGSVLEAGTKWEAASAIHYVTGALDLKPSQDGIENTLNQVPWPHTWNGSLWTLFYEALAYVGVAVLCVANPVRTRVHIIVPALTLMATLAYVTLPPTFFSSTFSSAFGAIADNGLRLWTHFLWGMLAYVAGKHIRFNRISFFGSTVLFLFLTHTSVLPETSGKIVGLISLVVAVLSAGSVLKTRIGSNTDLSYGIYIYAFPVQQLLILCGIANFGWLVTALSCVSITAVLALLSWKFVELPAINLKHLVPARHW